MKIAAEPQPKAKVTREREEARPVDIFKAAKILGLSHHTLRSWVRLRKIAFLKANRFKSSRILFERSVLRQWLKDHQVPISPVPVPAKAEGNGNGHASSEEVAKTAGNASFRRVFRPWVLSPEIIQHIKARALIKDEVMLGVIGKCFSTPASVRPESEGGTAITLMMGQGAGALTLPYAPQPKGLPEAQPAGPQEPSPPQDTPPPIDVDEEKD